MKYTVVWKPSAEKRLAEIWMASSDRQRIADAADRIDAYFEAATLMSITFLGDDYHWSEPHASSRIG
jgi:hypothetical protein